MLLGRSIDKNIADENGSEINRLNNNRIKKLHLIFSVIVLMCVLLFGFSYYHARQISIQNIERTRSEITEINYVLHNEILYRYGTIIENGNGQINQNSLNNLLSDVEMRIKTMRRINVTDSSIPWRIINIYYHDIYSYLLTIKSSLYYFQSPGNESRVNLISEEALRCLAICEQENQSLRSIHLQEKSAIIEKYINWADLNQQENRWLYLEAWNHALRLICNNEYVTIAVFRDAILKIEPSSFLFKYRLRENRIFNLLERRYETELGESFTNQYFVDDSSDVE